MRATPIAIASWLVPSAAVLITYFVSSSLGQVPTCIPFFDGCTSISGAARRDPSIHIFRAMMLPTATIIAAYWLHRDPGACPPRSGTVPRRSELPMRRP